MADPKRILGGLGKASKRLLMTEEEKLAQKFADPLAPATMRMSEALGNAGAEGKTLNFTEADRSRVFGKNRGGVGFSGLQHYSLPHKDANTVWGFGNKATAEKKIRQNDPDNSLFTTFVGSPQQHKSNSVVIGDAIKEFQKSVKKGVVPREQIVLMNKRLNEITDDKTGARVFEDGFDLTDPSALNVANTFSRRAAVGDVMLGLGVKGPMARLDFKKQYPGTKFTDGSDIENILKRETDPDLVDANTYDVGNRLFVMDGKIIERPDLNEAFPIQVTGDDLGFKYGLVPPDKAMRDFYKAREGRVDKNGRPSPVSYYDLSRAEPSQLVDEDYLTFLQKEGYKDGGSVNIKASDARLSAAMNKRMAKGGSVDIEAADARLNAAMAQRMAGGGGAFKKIAFMQEGGAAKGFKKLAFMAEGGTAFNAAPKKKKIAVFGDSISSVVGYKPDGKGSGTADTTNGANLAEYLGGGLDMDAANNAIGGQTSSDSLNGTAIPYAGQEIPLGYGNFSTYLKADNPEIAVLRFGAADAIRMKNPAQTVSNIEQMVQLAKENGTQPVLVGVTPFSNQGEFNSGNINSYLTDDMIQSAEDINAGIKALAEKYGVQFVDVRNVEVPPGGLIDGVHQNLEYGTNLSKYISDQVKGGLGSYEMADEGGFKLPSDWANFDPTSKINYFNENNIDAAKLAEVGVPQEDITWMQNNGYNGGAVQELALPDFGIPSPPKPTEPAPNLYQPSVVAQSIPEPTVEEPPAPVAPPVQPPQQMPEPMPEKMPEPAQVGYADGGSAFKTLQWAKPQHFDGGGIASPEENNTYAPESFFDSKRYSDIKKNAAELFAEGKQGLANDYDRLKNSSRARAQLAKIAAAQLAGGAPDLAHLGVDLIVDPLKSVTVDKLLTKPKYRSVMEAPLKPGEKQEREPMFGSLSDALKTEDGLPIGGSEHMIKRAQDAGLMSQGRFSPLTEIPAAIVGGLGVSKLGRGAVKGYNKLTGEKSVKLFPLQPEAMTAPAGTPQGATYATKQEGPFYRVSPTSLDVSGAKSRGLREADELQGQAPVGVGAGEAGSQVPLRVSDEEVARLISNPETNQPLQIAKQFTKDTQGTDFTLPDIPESSLAKQSAIGRAHQLAVEGSPEYKNSVFDAYAQQMPDVLEQAGAKNYDDLMEKAYRQLAKETDEQFQKLPYNFSYHKQGEGDYLGGSKEMMADVHGNKHLYVFQGGDPHDFLNRMDKASGLNENEKFRAVHDLMGHAIYGNQFGPKGEELAYAVHQQMYSPLARLAMASETRGQNSLVNYSPLNVKLKSNIAKLEDLEVEALRRKDTALVNEIRAAKRQEFSNNFQFAPQKAVLLPPEFIDPKFAGGLPEYLSAANRPAKGTETQSVLTHFSNNPDLQMLDPTRYGTGIKGAEAERLREGAGGVRDRSYVYLGEPGTIVPESGLGVNRYRGESQNLYDITQDPLGFRALARESNRTPFTAKYNAGITHPLQEANDYERLVKEYGYEGMINPNASKPMGIMFKPTPVQPRKSGGLTQLKAR